MKTKSLVEQVNATDYIVGEGDVPHSPASTIEQLKRYSKILAKMRKAGITEEEIRFIGDFDQADALHVFKLLAAKDVFEVKKASAN